MNFIESLSAVLAYIEAIIGLLERALLSKEKLRELFIRRRRGLTYENLFIKEQLDLQDAQGRRAILHRRQSVKVLTSELPIVRDLLWGDGEPLAHYRVTGARKLGVEHEGSKSVVVLALEGQGREGAIHVLQTRRLIRNEFSDRRGYFELLVERPTKRISLKVLFPPSRPPRETEITSTPARSHSRIARRCREDGRVALSWSQPHPEPFTQYRLRWVW